jgi:hypothetical protein
MTEPEKVYHFFKSCLFRPYIIRKILYSRSTGYVAGA